MKTSATGTEIRAFTRLEELRRSDNGIMSIEVFMGHDGHNAVRFRDYDKVIGEDASGGSLLDTVLKAESDWRYRNLTTTNYGKRTVENGIAYALQLFGSEVVFSTACFQTAIRTDAYAHLTDDHCLQLLINHPRIVRLKGGAHWLLLPDGYSKNDEI